jgi:hypothetical protein
MTGIKILTYCIFGYSIIILIISMILADDLRNPKFYKRCLIAAIISLLIGLLFEIANILNQVSGMTIVIMSMPSIYLIIYKVIFRIFKTWKGVDPYITSSSSRIGGQAIGGFWTDYPEGRKIMWSDVFFSITQALVPAFIIMSLLILIT